MMWIFISWDTWATMWDEYAYKREAMRHVVFILQLAKVKYWDGTPTIHNALFGTKICVNREIPKIVAFRTRVQEHEGYVKEMVGGIRDSEPVGLRVRETAWELTKKHGIDPDDYWPQESIRSKQAIKTAQWLEHTHKSTFTSTHGSESHEHLGLDPEEGKLYTTRAITIHAPVPWFLRKIMGQDMCHCVESTMVDAKTRSMQLATRNISPQKYLEAETFGQPDHILKFEYVDVGIVAYYLLLDNRFRNTNSYLGAEFQKPWMGTTVSVASALSHDPTGYIFVPSSKGITKYN
ncbi:protein slowmo [Tanacetum coccineum]